MKKHIIATASSEEAATVINHCPFCPPHETNVLADTNGEDWFVTCDSCDCIGPAAPTQAEAIRRWNQRPEIQQE
jgi:hypothetical protein